MRPFPAVIAILLSTTAVAHAATLNGTVRNSRGSAVVDAVVYAIPEGKERPVAKRTAIMDQKNRMFVPHVLPIQTGTSVKFPNSDDIRHQVYSFSSAKTFQLPLYEGTPSNPILFDKPGVAVLGCNIHDRMTAYIVVVDTPYFGTTAKNGRVKLDDLPGGKYVVHVWYPDMRREPAPQTIAIAGSEQKELSFTAR